MEHMEQNKGLFEETEQRLQNLMVESTDPEYTEYLKKLLNRLIQERYQVDLLKVELDRSYQMYQSRVQAKSEPMSVETESTTEAQAETMAVTENTVAQDLAEDILETTDTEAEAERKTELYFNTLEQKKPVEMRQETSFSESKNVYVKKNAEFTVGAAVLSVVGGAFILAALVTLGMTFMSGFFKGICLYGIALVFLLVSEIILYRRWPMLGTTISAIGIGGLYLSTAVNYLGLHNFNMWVTLIISLGVTIFTILLSRKRESVSYRIIGLIAGYLCFFTVQKGITETEFCVVTVMILIMNLATALLPIKKAGTALNITHMTVNALFTYAFSFYAAYCFADKAAELYILFFIFTSMVTQQLLLLVEFLKSEKKQLAMQETGVKEHDHSGILAVYYGSTAVFALLCSMITASLVASGSVELGYSVIAGIVVAVIGISAILAMRLCKCGGWQHVYIFVNALTFCIYASALNDLATMICLLVLVILSKMVSFKDSTAIRINDLCTTLLACFACMVADAPEKYIALAAVLVSVVMIKYWQTAYEIILSLTLVIFAVQNLNHLPLLQLPIVVGIMLVGILLFNNVKRWQGKNILAYNIVALIVQVICFAELTMPIYGNTYITYLFMLVFGLATIILTFQEKYHMDFKGKHMVLAIFLTYMAFVFKTSLPVINSVLLMAVALISVGIGFATAKKSVRIYGLVLSLFVCGKIVLYDFFKAATMQKTILFFVVGVIALAISTIYIVLEKKNGHLK